MAATIRYVGLDIHKRHVMAAGVNEQQETMMTPQKVAMQQFSSWAQEQLRPSDQVALEATSNAWELHDQLQPLVQRVSVANTFQLKLISASAAKTDKQDALVLAKLLAAHLLPTVWVPPPHVRDLRHLTHHRAQLMSQRGALKNKLHAQLHQHNLRPPAGDPFTEGNRSWWDNAPLNPTHRLQIRHYWRSIVKLTEGKRKRAQCGQLSRSDSRRQDR